MVGWFKNINAEEVLIEQLPQKKERSNMAKMKSKAKKEPKMKKEMKAPEMKKEASGLTAAQKKLPPALQKAIMAKKGK
jgi:hypothetical protein